MAWAWQEALLPVMFAHNYIGLMQISKKMFLVPVKHGAAFAPELGERALQQ